MSELPLPLSSSPAQHVSSDAIGRRSSPISSLAFLVHSPNTVANDLPPDVDNKPLARQKRRRTSKEDEEVLKAEYLKNPKPDKAARMQLVTKVALGEKEVQIWFQNKRQTERRRSRPMDSTSSTTLMSELSNMSDPATDDSCNAPEDEGTEEQISEMTSVEAQIVQAAEEQQESASPTAAEPAESAKEDVVNTEATPPVTPPAPTGNPDSQGSDDSIAVASTDPRTVDTAPTELSSSQQAQPSSQGAPQPRGSWISNRRSASFRYTEEYAQETITFPYPPQPITEPTEPVKGTRNLKRTHSFVRLSMTDDGTARVITDADKTPSPPHAKSNPTDHSRAAASLRRSYSAANLNERLAAVSRGEPSPKIARTSNIGRSRDSRAWEFWCDPDTRNSRSLTTRADQEGSGSAADAIGLLRANRRVLEANQTRQNTAVLSRNASAKALGEHSENIKKPRRPMQRASTISGRLQSKDGKEKKSGGSESDELPQTESDKENWEPDIPQSQSQYRRQRYPGTPTQSQRQRQILGENTEIMSQSSSLGAMLAREKGRRGSDEGSRSAEDPEQDEELRAFMNEGGRTNLNSAEEAGCVEGLLKLSQGNWR
ncbi:hypothetical protein K491DRAFT_693635 [Lophiostoma macrostomum CBS 122681]|uniref:Homeobox domain-containing protein n=1 Tax=Lophiostoma macrostomum CBS 122681 TaxID=1314788 RepID=A0A6A6T6P2_9PLEO|nr:hypothetical protein K491DRAFT_693635 [Lophiostoma macrostomum CBS 122681]